jgi:hypothetical protein
MSSESKFTAREYVQFIEMDDTCRHLLVEGRDDQRLFEVLLHSLLEDGDRRLIEIDNAQSFIGVDPSNRGIVEHVCERIDCETFHERLVGFVDREFRGFDDALLEDTIAGHKVSGRLVWSRGHSVENYVFDLSILWYPLVALSPNGFEESIGLFASVFESALRSACAIGLAARDTGKLTRVRSSINSGIVAVDDPRVVIDFEAWRNELESKLTEQEIETLFRNFHSWHDKLLDIDFDAVRWTCDGHIGFSFIWRVYEQCLALTANKNLLEVKRKVRFNICVNSWIRYVRSTRSGYPAEVLTLLGCD